MRTRSIKTYLAIAAVSLPVPAALHPQPSNEAGAVLRAGAARVDYTPRGPQLPGNFMGVLDPIFVRALVLDNGTTRAALVAVGALRVEDVYIGAVNAELSSRLKPGCAEKRIVDGLLESS